MPENAPRPGQATFAAWLIIGGSVILVLTAWQRISTLHTLEVQEELRAGAVGAAARPAPGSGSNGLKTTIRVMCMVAAAAATASTILGLQALRRSTSARLALTLLAPLVLIGGFATAGFFAPLVVAGVVHALAAPDPRLVRRPAVGSRRRSARGAAPTRPVRPAGRAHEPEQRAPGQPAPPAPRRRSTGPARSRAAVRRAAGGVATPAASPYGRRARSARRPDRGVRASCGCRAPSSSGFMLLFSLVMAVARDEFFDEIERQQPELRHEGHVPGRAGDRHLRGDGVHRAVVRGRDGAGRARDPPAAVGADRARGLHRHRRSGRCSARPSSARSSSCCWRRTA